MLRPALRTQIPKAMLRSRYLSSLAEVKRSWNGRLIISEEVEHALETGLPVVALESAIITHGMPYPANVNTASSIEAIIRSHAAVPSTIALIAGKVHVGLSHADLMHISDPTTRGDGAVKVSRRDIAAALAQQRIGGTTVAGTMVIAASVGVQSFVTGGIGGVHRGAESSMDVSADLIELGRTPMMVVCAGAKSILDIPRTLEVLETQGVCVATFGENHEFPAFYTPSSGLKSPWRVDSVKSAAELVYTGLTLPNPLSTLLAVPIPAEHAAAGDIVQAAVEQAVRESFAQGIDKRGKEVTPWLLKRVGELTAGSALELNIKLIENNAHVGAQVARELARLAKHASSSALYVPVMPDEGAGISLSSVLSTSASFSASAYAPKPPLKSASVLVFGSAAIDLTSSSPGTLVPRTTTPGSVFLSPGGVGRNIAEAAQNLLPPGQVKLVSAIGRDITAASSDDAFGKLLKMEMLSAGMRTDGLIGRPGHATAVCSLMLERDGDLVGGVADMNIVETIETHEVVSSIELEQPPKIVVFDCNLIPATISSLLEKCAGLQIPTFCDPTSTPKLARILPALKAYPRALTHMSPNILELDLLYNALVVDADEDSGWEFVNSLGLGAGWRASMDAWTRRPGFGWVKTNGVVTKMIACLPWIGSFWLKAGSRGLLHLRFETQKPQASEGSSTVACAVEAGPNAGQWLALTHYPSPVIGESEIISTTGAGDTLVGGLVAGLVAGGIDENKWVMKAVEQVGRSLRSKRAVA